MLLIPVVLLSYPTAMNWIFDKLGQDPDVASLAASWLNIYVVGVPFVLLFRVLQRFLSCQHVVWPLVYGAVVGCIFIQPFLMKWLVGSKGLLGSAIAIVLTQIIQSAFVMAYLKLRPVHKAETWQNHCNLETLRESLQCRPVLEFMRLSTGGVLSMTEWWFWEAVCFLVGHIGVVSLHIFMLPDSSPQKHTQTDFQGSIVCPYNRLQCHPRFLYDSSRHQCRIERLHWSYVWSK